jgi:hypothetical protein
MRELQHRDLSEYKGNVRSMEMIEKCNDTYAFCLAEQIAEQRLAGLPTEHLDQKLKIEMTRMFTSTRVMLGKPAYNEIMNKSK